MHEAVRWAAALSALVGFGLAMGLNPALYGATADMLARDVQAGRRLRWMIGGLATGATVLFLAFQSFDPTHLVTLLEQRVEAALLTRAVDIIAGVVLLAAAIGVIVWRIRVRHLPEHPAKAPAPSAHVFSYFTLGFGSAFVGFTTLPLMYLTGRVTAGLTDDLLLRVAAYGVFLIALGGPFFLLAWLWKRFPRLSRTLTGAYARAMRLDYRIALAVLLAIAGIVFLVIAIGRPA